MESILYRIYYGQFGPWDSTPKLEFYRKQQEAYAQQHDALLKKLEILEPSLREELIRLLDAQVTLDRMEPAEMFAEGFSMAVKLMVETLMSA